MDKSDNKSEASIADKIENVLQEISQMDINRNCDPLTLKSDETPIKTKNGITQNGTTPLKNQSKKPTTPHRILCKQASNKQNNVNTSNNENKEQTKIKKTRDITEFFPVRRSARKPKSVVKEEMVRNLENAIRTESEDGLKIQHFKDKGRGIIATKSFQRGEFVIEYIGDLIEFAEAKDREQKYAKDENTGCYMYYFKHNNQQYCIDATAESGKLGRLVNHSRNGNLMTKVVTVDKKPHLVLVAKEDLPVGTELTYDYGDRSKESLMHHPWLAL